MLHSSASESLSLVESIVQSFPSCFGAGLSHLRVRVVTPPPHVTGHSVQEPQMPQPPSTVSQNKDGVMCTTNGMCNIMHNFDILIWRIFLPGHGGLSLHTSTSLLVEPSFTQSFPWYNGIGLSHSRYLLRVAMPQFAVHLSQEPQELQLPLTTKIMVNYDNCTYFFRISIHFDSYYCVMTHYSYQDLVNEFFVFDIPHNRAQAKICEKI